MKFHGRLTPSVVADPGKVIQLILHQPAKAAGVTIKLWEMDTFVTAAGKTKKEGSADDLLATFQGAIAASGKRGAADWRKFTVASHKLEEAGEDVIRFKFKFAGADTVYEVPILSEEGEAEGKSFELGFSIEHGGKEVFKTKSPLLFDIPLTKVRGLRRRFTRRLKDGKVDPKSAMVEPLAHQWIAIGVREGEGAAAVLKVLSCGYLDSSGYLVEPPPDDKKAPPPQPIMLRHDRRYLAYLLDKKTDHRGKSEMRAGASYRIKHDGTFQVDLASSGDLRYWFTPEDVKQAITGTQGTTMPSILAGANQQSGGKIEAEGAASFGGIGAVIRRAKPRPRGRR